MPILILILKKKPALLDAPLSICGKAHLFGHVHEQRGVWVKSGDSDGSFRGGVEFRLADGQPPLCAGPPHPSYPPQVISNNAMKNNPALEGRPARISGPPRLIVARRKNVEAEWEFGVLT